ncbi:MAG TPA: L-histidine N(alpha)-methyltransferase [Longimicrobiales bacterium]|nr:L-histidine N(alpha)-methyltransferase [Longimicrobiales bacterium]
MQPDRLAAMRAAVRDGMHARPRIIPPKFFYDERGSELFEAITALPEYYPTRAEREILDTRVAAWIRELEPRSLVELGAGSAEKTRILLEAMLEVAGAARVLYAPVDVSADFLRATAERLAAAYPTLDVMPIVADLTQDFQLPDDLPRPLVVAFLGSTIGNFGRGDAAALLRRAAVSLADADRLLLGVDLKKDPALLNAAYNDSAGVTAEFDLNVLRVLNRELGADFDPDAFRHHAFYDEAGGRVEMHLVATQAMRVTIPEVGTFDLEAGESILTEISRKYDHAEVDVTLAGAGLAVEHWFEVPPGYAVVVAKTVAGSR